MIATTDVLSNGKIRVGINLNAGGAITQLSTITGKNRVSTYDLGRLIQQSVYGDVDGSMWAGKPWFFNAVQGGWSDGKTGPAAKVLAHTSASIVTQSRGVHWATGQDLPVTFTQYIVLNGYAVHVTYVTDYVGTVSHAPRHQELPAVFGSTDHTKLVLADGRVIRPGFANEYYSLPSGFVALMDSSGYGFGLKHVGINMFTTYSRADEVAGPTDSGCLYVAPIETFGLTPGLHKTYSVSFTVGSLAQIKSRFGV